MEKKKYSIWFYFVLVLIPILFFIILEGALRIFGYGNNYSTFIEIQELAPGEYFFNPDLPKKYFPNTSVIPSVIPDPFDKEKQSNTIRIFVLGGSTTAGYPYSTNASFSRRIKRKLELLYPENKIEVVNLGVSAVNSYFLYDILPDVLEQKPDLILIYAGHNEYYGSLGPASSEFISSNPTIVRLVLFFREFKIYQLLNSFINTMADIFSSNSEKPRGTLMKEMIEKQEIPLDSTIYLEGVNQYRENMIAIIKLCNKKNIPVVVGDLISNLKQKPLGSDDKAEEYFELAKEFLIEEDTLRSFELYEKAKDEDPLRFRAPEDFNLFLKELNLESNFDLVEVKNEFAKNSSDKIPGFDLMIDHLHPNLDGYKLMSDLFFKSIDKLLSERFKKADKISEAAIDQYLKENFPFTRYDSTLADIKIQILLNDFPFKIENKFDLRTYELNNFADTLAIRSISSGLGWAESHLKLFDHYYNNNKFDKAVKELFTLMEERPFYKSALYYAIPKLISAGEVRGAKHILVRNHRRYPDGFTSKQLGLINLQEGNLNLANKLLNEAAKYFPDDPEIYFNLSRTYFGMKDLELAISSMAKCLALSPNYPEAQEIYDRLEKLRKQN